MQELKRCPFCGGPAEEVVTGKNTGDWKYRIRCKECGITTGATVCSPTHVDKWNRRKVLDTCSRCKWWQEHGEKGVPYCRISHLRNGAHDFCSRFEELER